VELLREMVPGYHPMDGEGKYRIRGLKSKTKKQD